MTDEGQGVVVQNHQTYVPCKEGSSTQFWYFGDQDRIAIVTKDINDVYDFFYIGVIDSIIQDNKLPPQRYCHLA
jgi:hypothetical protein